MPFVQSTLLARKLNLGCGWDRRDGYLNVDFQEFHEPDLVADVCDLSMLPSGHFEQIVARDVLEHLERQATDVALAEWARLLQPGGELILRLPNVIGLARLLSEQRDIEQQRTLLQNMYGTQAYNGDYHHAGFTEVSIRHALADAGFEVRSLLCQHVWLFDIVAVRVEGRVEPDLESLDFMELCPNAPSPSNNAPQPAGAIRRAAGAVGRRLPPRLQPPLKRVYARAFRAMQ